MVELQATILRGKRKGQIVELHQYCNDWASLEDGSIVSLGSVELLSGAYHRFMEDYKADREEHTTKRLGQMFRMFYDFETFMLTGRFKRRKTTRK